MVVQPNKAIVGANAFAHASGIHQDGLLKDARTYEIMRPDSVGLTHSRFVMGKLSGRHAFRDALEKLGYALTDEEIRTAFERFKHLADQKELFEEDLEAIVSEIVAKVPERYSLKAMNTRSGMNQSPMATVALEMDGRMVEESGTGDGPVDAVYRTIAGITQTKSTLLSYRVQAITGGTDAQGEVSVRVQQDGETVVGNGANTDIIVASAQAYINALNKLTLRLERRASAGPKIGPC